MDRLLLAPGHRVPTLRRGQLGDRRRAGLHDFRRQRLAARRYLRDGRLPPRHATGTILSMSASPFPMEELLGRHEPALAALIRREAGVALLQFDSLEDLLQGVRYEAIRSAASFEWRGETAF